MVRMVLGRPCNHAECLDPVESEEMTQFELQKVCFHNECKIRGILKTLY